MGNNFADEMKPKKFDSSKFQRWSTKLYLCSLLWTSLGLSSLMKVLSNYWKTSVIRQDNVIVVGCILSVLSDKLYDAYMKMKIKSARELMELSNINTVHPILDMSCMSLSIVMIIRWLATTLRLTKLMRFNSLLVSSSNMDISFLIHLWQGASL